jgi:MFS transporter, MHS family, proline/betaine transporter
MRKRPLSVSVKYIVRKASIAAAAEAETEHYEFSIYGFVATIMRPLFFPTGNATAALLNTSNQWI